MSHLMVCKKKGETVLIQKGFFKWYYVNGSHLGVRISADWQQHHGRV